MFPCISSWIELFQKKSKQRVLRTYFFEKDPWNFYICNFILGNFTKTCYTHWNSKDKNQDPWKFHTIFFLIIPGNSTSFFIDSWSFHIPFFQSLWKFHVLNPPSPPMFVFFWNSPLEVVTASCTCFEQQDNEPKP